MNTDTTDYSPFRNRIEACEFLQWLWDHHRSMWNSLPGGDSLWVNIRARAANPKSKMRPLLTRWLLERER